MQSACFRFALRTRDARLDTRWLVLHLAERACANFLYIGGAVGFYLVFYCKRLNGDNRTHRVTYYT